MSCGQDRILMLNGQAKRLSKMTFPTETHHFIAFHSFSMRDVALKLESRGERRDGQRARGADLVLSQPGARISKNSYLDAFKETFLDHNVS